MIGEQHEIPVERAGLDGVRNLAGTHIEEVPGLRQIGARIDRLQSAADAIPRGHDGRHFGDQFDGGVHVGQMLAMRVDRRKQP